MLFEDTAHIERGKLQGSHWCHRCSAKVHHKYTLIEQSLLSLVIALTIISN